jgi:hypothetical protein
MKDMPEELKSLFMDAAADNFTEYRRVIELCAQRNTAEEGIPAIIGLDDMTDGGRSAFEGAPMDGDMRLAMAADTLIFNWLYSEDKERNQHYPSIAPAMSALAEKRFYTEDGKDGARGYRAMQEDA